MAVSVPARLRSIGAASPPQAGGDNRRVALCFLGAFMAYWPIAGACDSLGGGLAVQNVIGATTWLFLVAAIWSAPPALRISALSMVLVATAFECLGSLIWCAYRYRYHNLPLYVPPGHGLFYLTALRFSMLPAVRRYGRIVVVAVVVASAGWALHGLLAGPRADVFGALCWLLLAYFLRRGRDPLLFALTFALTMALEFYGTSLGIWHWAAVLPGTHVTAGNPPAAIGAGYCVFDALSMRLALYLGPAFAALGAPLYAMLPARLTVARPVSRRSAAGD